MKTYIHTHHSPIKLKPIYYGTTSCNSPRISYLSIYTYIRHSFIFLVISHSLPLQTLIHAFFFPLQTNKQTTSSTHLHSSLSTPVPKLHKYLLPLNTHHQPTTQTRNFSTSTSSSPDFFLSFSGSQTIIFNQSLLSTPHHRTTCLPTNIPSAY